MRLIHKDDIEHLVKGCRNGDRNAQRKFYEYFAERMYAVCLRYGKDDLEADEILQEGFIRVFNKIHTYKGIGSLEGWVRRVVVNCAIRYCQNKKRLYKVVHLEEINGEAVAKAIEECEFSMDDLTGMIRELPEGYRLVFNLYAIEGYSHKEIGQKLEISEGTSKSQLARARKHLQALIKQRQQENKQFENGQSAG